MVRIVKTRRVHCKIRHIDTFATDWSDGNTTIRCVYRRHCNNCPYENRKQ